MNDLITELCSIRLPVVTGNRFIWGRTKGAFTMGVEGNIPGKESFVIDTGDEQNDVQVIAKDEGLKQLVLSVHEPSREIEMSEGFRNVNGKYIQTLRKQMTPEEKRYYLMGMDERSLFISGLPADVPDDIESVQDAYTLLKPHEVEDAENEGRRVMRQGEWFFVKMTQSEEKSMFTHVDEHPELLKRSYRLRRGGNRPHMCKQYVGLRRGKKRHAQGMITHLQHVPLRLPTWHRIYGNLETESPGVRGFVD